MKRPDWTTALAAAALSALIAAGAAEAQTATPAEPAPAPVKHAPKMAAAKSGAAVAVSVWNSRSADLAELQAVPSGSDAFKKVLGGLKAGKKTGARVPKGADCLIDLRATFADGQTTEATGVDVCKQKILNLTE